MGWPEQPRPRRRKAPIKLPSAAAASSSEFVATHGYADGTWSGPGYRSARTRAKWAQALFALMALAGLSEASVSLQGIDLFGRALNGELISSTEANSFVAGARAADNFYLWCVVGLAIAFLAWLSRTVEITPALGAGTPTDSPRWAIGWWFVPIAFLWKPYQVVRELWDRLATPTRTTGGLVVIVWWLAWIGQAILGRAANAYRDAAPDLEGIRSALLLLLAAAALSTVAAVCGFFIVREVQARADERAAAFGLETQWAPRTPELRSAELGKRERERAKVERSRAEAGFPNCGNCGAKKWEQIGAPKLNSLGSPYARFKCRRCEAQASLYRDGRKWRYRGQ
jgi:hypothetical protein